jgi:transposase-like protein
MLSLQREVDRMPWREVTRMSLREEFVQLALQAGVNRRELCRRFGIAPKTGYKWLMRYARAGASGLEDRSKRPLRSPARTAAEVEQAVIRLRATRGADASLRGCSQARGAQRWRRAP